MSFSEDATTWFYAMSLVGLPYRWGGDDPIKGFDCSGLAIELLISQGILPHRFDATAQNLWERFSDRRFGKPVIDAKFGALAFYGDNKGVKHVGFLIDTYRIIEAGGGGSSTTSTEIAALQNAFVRIRPADYRSDFLGFLKPHSYEP